MTVAAKVSAVPILILATLFSSGISINNGDKSGSKPDWIEANVYQAFIKEYTAWAGGCPKAVLDLKALVQKPTDTLGFQPKTSSPPPDLIAQLISSISNHESLTVDGRPFFVPVEDFILQKIFRWDSNCTPHEMKQHKCGWPKFQDEFGKTCGIWQFSHVTFNSAGNQALFSYGLSNPHWGEGGYAFMELRNEKWTVTSVSISFIS